jgi:hypothetical protein
MRLPTRDRQEEPGALAVVRAGEGAALCRGDGAADAIILDLEGSVAASEKARARVCRLLSIECPMLRRSLQIGRLEGRRRQASSLPLPARFDGRASA